MPTRFGLAKKKGKLNLCNRQMCSWEGVMWLLHSLEGPDQVVQVGGDVVHGELQGADDFVEAKAQHTRSVDDARMELNGSQQMQKLPRVEEEHRLVETKEQRSVEIRTSW